MPGLRITYPANILIFFGTLQPYVTFDFLPSKYSTELILNFDWMAHEPYSDELNELDMDNSNFVINMGSVFLIVCHLVILTIFYYILRLLYEISRRKCKSF